MIVKDLYEIERPREKLLTKGAAALSDGELLAILIRTGTQGSSSIELAQNLLKLVNGRLGRFADLTAGEICKVKGIGKDKTAIILAAFELGKRFIEDRAFCDDIPVTGAKMIYDLLIPRLKGLKHEECWTVYLNSSQQIIVKERLTSGGSDQTTIDNKMILKRALSLGASFIILAHNHPTNNPRPSNADIKSTKALDCACKSVGLMLLDHVIISDGTFFSFADDSVCKV